MSPYLLGLLVVGGWGGVNFVHGWGSEYVGHDLSNMHQLRAQVLTFAD